MDKRVLAAGLVGIVIGSLLTGVTDAQQRRRTPQTIVDPLYDVRPHHEPSTHECFLVTGGGGIVKVQDKVCHAAPPK